MASTSTKPKIKRHPEKFEENRHNAKAELEDHLPQIIEKMNWGQNELILDHGCGTGSTCLKHIVPEAERTDSMIYALDHCESMITHAKEKFPHPRVNYVVGEVTDLDDLPFKNLKFNRIFSLHVLFLVKDYKKELKALYDLLVPGGELFVITVSDCHAFDLFESLHEHEKFSDHAKDHLHIPEWRNEDGSDALKETMEKVGFEILEYETHDKTWTFEKAAVLVDLMMSLNSFAEHLSEEERQELRHVYHKYALETPTKTHDPTDHTEHMEYTVTYETKHILVRKPITLLNLLF